MKPTIGRIVHYVSQDDGAHQAAIISRAQDGHELVSLHVMDSYGVSVYSGIPHNEEKAPNTWHWPERE